MSPVCSFPQHHAIRNFLFLATLLAAVLLMSVPAAVNAQEVNDDPAAELKVMEVKGDFVKLDLPEDKSAADAVVKGATGKIYRGERKASVGATKITVIEDGYVVGKLTRGSAKTGDVVRMIVAKSKTKKTEKSKSKKPALFVIPEEELNTPIDQATLQKHLMELHASERMLSEMQYPQLRNLYSRRFEDEHASEIKSAFGEDFEAMQQWLNENRVIKEELFNAIDSENDNVERALQIFAEIKKEFPEKIVPYSSLAIASSVVWDGRRGVYDYQRHQKRAKASLPEEQMDSAEGFQYLVDAEPFMEGRILYVPWEFLKHVVNHYTPKEERLWAAEMYYPKRQDFAKCYHDVPYDHLMLETQSKQGKLNDHEYTLSNLKKYGGVCAHQADFASRVGKSIGIPAEYVRGPGTFGSYHAWVMWIELKSITKKSIKFSLESYGRYNDDLYYVGELQDPQTGRWVTDRLLELRLHTVGQNAVAKRHSDLIMKSYPTIVSEAKLETKDQIELLRQIIGLCPGNELAWQSLAELSTKFVAEDDKRNRRKMLDIIDSMFTNFGNFPDFTWKLFEPITAFETDPDRRHNLYNRLLSQYLKAERPDLAMEARLRLTDHLLDDGDKLVAIEGLAKTILALPHEARYVPKMLDRIDAICESEPELAMHRADFYAQFLPKIPKYRGTTPSKFCLQMFERAIKLFEAESKPELAAGAKKELADIKSGEALKRERKKR